MIRNGKSILIKEKSKKLHFDLDLSYNMLSFNKYKYNLINRSQSTPNFT
jgi:hypothetical protein